MYQRWPKRDPNKHYYLVPNEVFNLGLSSHEIAVYNYLLRCEDRRTYQCHPSYRTIGKAVQLSENTVRKYVAGLEEKGLIRTEPSTITTKDGRVRNGSLKVTYFLQIMRDSLSRTFCWFSSTHWLDVLNFLSALTLSNSQPWVVAISANIKSTGISTPE